MDLTADRLRAVLDYNPDTGAFIWKVNVSRKVRAGCPAGSTPSSYGYGQIKIDGCVYRAHRLAWLHATGEWPLNIDHINMRKLDNRFCNLRSVTKSQNQMHTFRQKNNTSGFKGVSWDIEKQKWAAYIKKDSKRYFLGRFDCSASAHAAYTEAADKLFGEYARA